MNFQNVKVPKMPGGGGGAAANLVKVGILGALGLGAYGVSHSMYNVEGGHRAIVFNRISGIKDKVNVLSEATLLHLYVVVLQIQIQFLANL